MKAKAWCMIPHSKKDGVEIEMKPLVLCEDCKFFDTDNGDTSGLTGFCPNTGCNVSIKWFCADGEERGEDE